MVAIGALAGFAIATSWGRLATAPTADAPPAADVREAGPDDLPPPGPAPSE